MVDLLAVDAGVEAEVKVFKGADVAEASTFGASLYGALFTYVEFVSHEEFEELFVGKVVADGFL